MQPSLKQADKQYSASRKERSLLSRATPAFWLGAVLCSFLLCLILFSGARSMFRTRYDAPLAPQAAGGLLPTTVSAAAGPVVHSVATGIPQLVWTVDMTPLSNGQYMVPDKIKGQIQQTFESALGALDGLPWERFTPASLFTGQALANAAPIADARDTAVLTKTVPGTRNFGIVGCDRAGGICTVTEVYAHISLDQYDPISQKKLGTVPLAGDVMYLFSGQMVWTPSGWRVGSLDEPITAHKEP